MLLRGRSAKTVYGGREHLLRQTVIALKAGEKLAEHGNPGEATVYFEPYLPHGEIVCTVCG